MCPGIKGLLSLRSNRCRYAQMIMDNLTEEEMILLLRSLLFRAKAGGKHAEVAGKIKRLSILKL